jgi:hypothetical protein
MTPTSLALAIGAAAFDSAGNSHLSAGNLHVLMYHRHLLSAAVPQPRQRRRPILKCRHEPSGCIHMPGLVNRVPAIIDLRKLSHRVNVSGCHLMCQQLLDAVLRLDRLGRINGNVQAAGVELCRNLGDDD